MKPDFDAARAWAQDRIAATPLTPDPHWHGWVEEVFPPDFYTGLRAALPDDAAYTPLSAQWDPGGDYTARRGLAIDDAAIAAMEADRAAFWRDLNTRTLGRAFGESLLRVAAGPVAARFAAEGTELGSWRTSLLLVRDRGGPGVLPHTSDPPNVLTLLFYLPPDDTNRAQGTALYAPRDPDLRCWGGRHHGRAAFDHVWTAPFLPNSLFWFVKDDMSFHGVEPAPHGEAVRDILLFYIKRTG